VSEPIGDIPDKVDYYRQASKLHQTKELFPEYKNIYADCQQQNLMRLDKAWKRKRIRLLVFTFTLLVSAKSFIIKSPIGYVTNTT
jgi:transposase